MYIGDEKGVVDKIPSTLGSSTTSGSTTGSGAASTTSSGLKKK